MRTSGICPKCHCNVLWYVADVAKNTEIGYLEQQPTFQLAVVGLGKKGCAGKTEAYACQQCGYIELYLKERLTVDGAYVFERRPQPGSPYRG